MVDGKDAIDWLNEEPISAYIICSQEECNANLKLLKHFIDHKYLENVASSVRLMTSL